MIHNDNRNLFFYRVLLRLYCSVHYCGQYCIWGYRSTIETAAYVFFELTKKISVLNISNITVFTFQYLYYSKCPICPHLP